MYCAWIQFVAMDSANAICLIEEIIRATTADGLTGGKVYDARIHRYGSSGEIDTDLSSSRKQLRKRSRWRSSPRAPTAGWWWWFL
jgi:hypothetical protein